MMNPTPEQLAFALATLTLDRDGPSRDADFLPPSLNGLLRIVALLIVGFATGLLGLSYVEGTLATGGRSQEEIHAMNDPSPLAKDVFGDDTATRGETVWAQ